MDSQDRHLNDQCNKLKSLWTDRDIEVKKWYEDLSLKNVLEQTNMESVISNDPRTSFDLALHLLTSSLITHKIEDDPVFQHPPEDVSYIQTYLHSRWRNLKAQFRQLGKQSVLRPIASFPLATGWIAVHPYATNEELGLEVWNPMQVYPRYDGYSGMTECMREYSTSYDAAKRKAEEFHWRMPDVGIPAGGNIRVRNYFYYNEAGLLCNTVLYNGMVAKEPAPIPGTVQNSQRIPIFISPVGGIPDDGTILSSSEYQKHVGEAMVAKNRAVNLNHNKMMTFLQQLIRDTANPRIVEKTRGDTPIVTEENFFSRGAMYRIGPDEDISTIQMPAIPLEMSSMQFSYENMKQRGSFPWVLHGNIQQRLTGYMVSQIAAASLSTLTPFADIVSGTLEDVDNFWLGEIVARGLTPYNYEKKDSVKNMRVGVSLSIDIPGSLIQRITMAKMANQAFELDTDTIYKYMFPEIEDPLESQAKLRRAEAERHPLAKLAVMYSSYKAIVRESIQAGDTDTAEIYTALLAKVQAAISATPAIEGQEPTPPGKEAGVRREVQPKEGRSPNFPQF